jgi:hypothetical protein
MQVALLLRIASGQRTALMISGGMFLAATLLIVLAPLAPVGGLTGASSADGLSAAGIALQSITLAVFTALIARLLGRASGPALMLAISAAIVWWLIVVPSGGLVLAFVAVATTLIARRRKVRS